MIFKKKKAMDDNTKNNSEAGAQNGDNLTGNEQVTENMSTGEETAAMVETEDDKSAKLQAALDEQKDKYLRLVAEFDNFRKRSRKEHLELEQTAGKDVIVSMLVVLDDMNRAAKQMEATDDVKSIKEGVTLVFNKMRDILQKRGLKAMETKQEDFNPDLHEAITEIPVENEDMAGVIIDVVEPGYYLNEKLIRFAKVVIGKRSEPKSL